MKKRVLYLLFALFSHASHAQPPKRVTVTGSWTVTVPSSLITDAGMDYTQTFISATNQSLLDFKTGLAPSYTIFVQKMDTDWHPNLSLWIKRTGQGNGSGGRTIPMTGGENFMQVTNSPQPFFYDASNSTHNRNNVPIQYQIQGLSVIIPVKSYSTTLMFTISD
jgi:hypothetical protein